MAITRLNSRLIPYASIGVAATRTRDNRPDASRKRRRETGGGTYRRFIDMQSSAEEGNKLEVEALGGFRSYLHSSFDSAPYIGKSA